MSTARVCAGPVLGVLSPVVGGYYFGSLLAGISAVAKAAGGTVLVLQTLDAGVENGEPSELLPRSAPVGWEHIDGFLLLVNSAQPHEVKSLLDTGKPVVAVSFSSDGVEVANVGPDNAGGVRQAVEHLLDHGHRRIGFVGSGDHIDMVTRIRAYRDTMREHGIEPDPSLHFTTAGPAWYAYSQAGGRAAASQMLAAGMPSTAVVCATDYNALGVVRRLQEAGCVVPRDQAVIGFDDTEVAAFVSPPLASVSQPFDEVGARAAQVVLDALAARARFRAAGGSADDYRAVVGAVPVDHLVPTRLVRRASCGCWQPARTIVPDDHPVGRLREVLADLVPQGRSDDSALRQCCEVVANWAQSATTAEHSDPDAQALAAIEALYRLSPRPETANAIIWALQRFIDEVADPAFARTGGHIVADAAVLLTGVQVGDEYKVIERFERTLDNQYEINMELLNSAERDPASLSWARATEASVACLGVWSSSLADVDGRLDLVGAFARDDTPPTVGARMDVRAFPPPALLATSAASDTEIVFVIPVRGRGNDRGLLAVSAPIETRAANGRQTFNQWAAMLGVALRHEEVLSRLQEQRAELSDAIDRERELRESVWLSQERYAIAVRATNDGIWDWDLGNDRVYYSRRCADLFDTTHAQLSGTPQDWLTRVHASDAAGLRQALQEHLSGASDVLEHEHRICDSTGQARWMLVRAAVVRDEAGSALRLVGSLSDVHDRRELEDQLRKAALFDPLTGLPNRALFQDRLTSAISRAQRNPAHGFAVMFLDLDGFKVVNDSLGHHVGDLLLIEVARAISESLRPPDTGARFGGDEFAILVDNLDDLADVPTIASRLQQRLGSPLSLAGHEVVVSASIGIALSSHGYTDAQDVLRDADTAMYRSKSTGRGRSTFFDTAMHARVLNRLTVESGIRHAVGAGELELHYQPIVGLPQQTCVGVEALLRWRHPQRGLLLPAGFMTVAEESGLIIGIGQWVIEEACQALARWQSEGRAPASLRMSVNLSHREFWHPELLDHLDATLARHHVAGASLAVEITEGVIMDNPDAARGILSVMQARGIDVHIDDFGTGFSSLSALHELPLQALKIDRSFVQRLGTSSKTRELVRTMVTMSEGLGMTAIAEGIETAEQLAVLVDLGCPFGQGNLLGLPSPEAPR